MAEIVTLTINPSVDISTSVERVSPVRKLRCTPAHRDAGGGGINVARVVRRFGMDVVATYPAGGSVGELLKRLVDQDGIESHAIPIAGETREDFTVFEEATGQEFRFVLPGPELSSDEWRQCLRIFSSPGDGAQFVVASGSLAPSVPSDFYGRIAETVRPVGAKMIVDTSGPALKRALESGLYLIKPNLHELQDLVGEMLDDRNSWFTACRRLVDAQQVEIVALTLGHRGAMLVTRDQAWFAEPVSVKVVSAVGAGDSFLGALVWALASGKNMADAFRYGLAAGSAALLTPGTDLCKREDVERLLNDVKLQAI
jgi:6-phosphofructokinase 2